MSSPPARVSVAILRPVRLHPGPDGETIAPARLGRSFRWLLASSVVTNVGDGIALAAGPLLVASQTRDPFLVSMALLSQQPAEPALRRPGGAVADRFDRVASSRSSTSPGRPC